MNYLFISPNYPAGHWRYVASLRDAGHNVYGIGDAGDETFPAELRGNLSGYYRVGDLHNYEEVYRGCCYFIYSFGRFQAVDSLNPYWCDLVAAIKRDFIDSASDTESCYAAMRTAQMCEEPEQRTFAAGDEDQAAELAAALGGYPVLLIPAKDKRLGVRRVKNEEDLRITVASSEPDSWLIRRFAEGEPLSVDCLCSCRIEPGLGVSELLPVAWGIHAFGEDGCAWGLPVSDSALAQLSQNVLPALYSDRSGLVFFHADCVRLQKAVKGLGKKGDIILNEWWQTPPHEFVLDCMNIEYDCDLRGIWAYGEAPAEPLEQRFCAAIASRSFERSYKNPHEKIMRRLAGKLRIHARTAPFDSGAFLDYHYIFSGADVAELKRGIKFITEDHKEPERPVPDAADVKKAGTISAPADDAADERPAADSFALSFERALDELRRSAEKDAEDGKLPDKPAGEQIETPEETKPAKEKKKPSGKSASAGKKKQPAKAKSAEKESIEQPKEEKTTEQSAETLEAKPAEWAEDKHADGPKAEPAKSAEALEDKHADGPKAEPAKMAETLEAKPAERAEMLEAKPAERAEDKHADGPKAEPAKSAEALEDKPTEWAGEDSNNADN